MRANLSCGVRLPRSLGARMAHYEECSHPECQTRARKLKKVLAFMALPFKLRNMAEHDS